MCILPRVDRTGVFTGPIAPSIQPSYGWSDAEIALLANWGPICYLIAVLPSSWLMDCKGVKLSMQVAMLTITLGSGLRLIPTGTTEGFRLVVHAGQILNGLAGPIAMSIPPVVSSTFFPTEQRTLATSIMSVANYVGVALTFIAGPAIVDNPSHVQHKVFIYLAGQTVLCGIGLVGVAL